MCGGAHVMAEDENFVVGGRQTMAAIADEVLLQCERLLKRGAYAKAEAATEAGTDRPEHRWRVRAVAARCCLEIGKLEGDAERLRRAVPLFGDALAAMRGAALSGPLAAAAEANLLNDRGVCKYELVLFTGVAGDMFRDARLDFEAALQIEPEHDRALCNLGLVQWKSGAERAALATLDRAVEANRCNPHSLNNRGRLLLELTGCHQRALPDFHRAVTLDPWYQVARRNRDEALTCLGEPTPLEEVPEPRLAASQQAS